MERSLFRFFAIFQRSKKGTHPWRIVNNCLKYYLLIAQITWLAQSFFNSINISLFFTLQFVLLWFAPLLVFSYYENIQGFAFLKKSNSQLILHHQEPNYFNWYFTSSQKLFHCMLVNQIILSKTLNLVYIRTYLLALDKLFIPYQDLAALICYPKQIIAILMKVIENILILLITIFWVTIRKEITKYLRKQCHFIYD